MEESSGLDRRYHKTVRGISLCHAAAQFEKRDRSGTAETGTDGQLSADGSVSAVAFLLLRLFDHCSFHRNRADRALFQKISGLA